HADRNAQLEAFDAQLDLAARLNLPVVIHTREADDDTRSVLTNHSGSLSHKGVIHSFTSSLSLAEYCLNEGFMLGFNGITTFRNADNVRAVVDATPVERIVLETDAPYLTPAPYRGRPNAPCYLPFIAEKLAEIKALPVEEMLSHARDNSHRLFF
ncbi:MAG: TatD family hydrolase, partial [Halieaceae bacterium]